MLLTLGPSCFFWPESNLASPEIEFKGCLPAKNNSKGCLVSSPPPIQPCRAARYPPLRLTTMSRVVPRHATDSVVPRKPARNYGPPQLTPAWRKITTNGPGPPVGTRRLGRTITPPSGRERGVRILCVRG
jgi:hypothetical protein